METRILSGKKVAEAMKAELTQELQELGEELRRVEEQDDVLCVWSPTFSVWVNRT